MTGMESPNHSRKSEVVAEVRARHRRARRSDRQERWAEIRCFWTFPFGHVHEQMQCVNCGHWQSIL